MNRAVTVTLRIGGQPLVAELDEVALAELGAAVDHARVSAPAEPWPEWMSLPTAARYLDCPEERLRKLLAKNAIPYAQEGPGCRVFFERAELDSWMRDQATTPRWPA